jgi:hypothetical protein
MSAWPRSALRFPCNVEKEPLTLRGFRDAKRFYYDSAWPLVGLPTGHDFICIDFDPGGLEHAGLLPQDTFVQQTRRGLHHFYLAEPGWPSVVLLMPGRLVELKAANAYVIDWSREGLPNNGLPLRRIGMGLAELKALFAPFWREGRGEEGREVPGFTAGATFGAGASVTVGEPLRIRRKAWKRTYNVRACEGGIVRRVAMAKRGERNPTLWEMADLCGGMIVEGSITRSGAEAMLMLACKHNGLLAEDGEKKCRATIRSGLEAGIAYWSLPLEEGQ